MAARTREELIDNLMHENASFILGNGATYAAGVTIRELLAIALKDEDTFQSTWKKFFKD